MGDHRASGLHPTHENRLIAALPAAVRAHLLPLMTEIPHRVRDTLYRPGGPIDYVYFPRSGVISVVTTLENGGNVEVAIVGNDGMVGIPSVMGVNRSFHHVYCQVASSAWRMRADQFRDELEKNPPLKELCFRYLQAFLNSMSQSVACANQHSVKNRFARWLLITQDRVGSDEIALTQEFLALMLGVRRASVTVAANGYQQAGLIRYHRGKITILDREGLEAASCECYRVIRDELARVTG